MKPGYYKCSRCNGTGKVEFHSEDHSEWSFSTNDRCPKCHGKKILDWVENVTGVKDPLFLFTPQNIREWTINTVQDTIDVTAFGELQKQYTSGSTRVYIDFETDVSALGCEVGDMIKVQANGFVGEFMVTKMDIESNKCRISGEKV